jgi:hypothetical protein
MFSHKPLTMNHLHRPDNDQQQTRVDRCSTSIVPFAAVLVLCLISNSTMAADQSRHAAAQTDTDEQAERSLTPPPGSPERRAILDTLRMELGHLAGPDLVFVVGHLKVHTGWAWIHAFPQSRDGRNRYEDVSALLHKQGRRWRVEHLASGGDACAEEPDTGDCGAPTVRYPAAPPEIFTLDGTSAPIIPD